ncbi:hypothetical protein Vafri_9737 [Volvox africanus]|uniref:Amino acid permease n=1 Tax=Volvox africanus TaxID=51714 RepID=A0A8J4B5G9_9CHLO|nr:hypothetical protein Vafri_9737 [Volvox africanus]
MNRSKSRSDKDGLHAFSFRRHGSMSRGAAPNPIRRRANTDEVKLLMLGYRQELSREFTLFNCFGCSFTALSSFTALGGTYGFGLTYGGPVVMTWGWLVVTLFTISMGLSMAELASAYPTSGALYYWSFKLAPRRLRNLTCWMTGWILTMGQAAFSASNSFTFVHLLCTAIKMQFGIDMKSVHQLLLLLGSLVIVGVLNCGSARLTAFVTTLGTFWHLIALAAFCVTVPLLAPQRQSAKYVYTSWQPHHEYTGISSPVYTVLVGLLMQQWTLTGYDGAAHIAEETHHAEVNVPRAILLAILAVGITGYAFVLSLLFVRLDYSLLLDPANEMDGGNVVLQILVELTKATYGSASAGVALFTIPIIGTFFCSYQSIANNSRMLYAFARDKGVPLAAFAKMVHPRTKAPIFGVAYMLVLTALLAAPMCFNAFVFPAVTSFAVVGCYLAYSLPVLCKVTTGVRCFLPGPFYLGPRLSYANNVISLMWVGTVTVLFTLPQFYPIDLINMNWSAPILGLAIFFALGWYYLPKYGAKKWFIGPRANLGQFNDALPSAAARLASQDARAADLAAAAAMATAAARLSLVHEEPELEPEVALEMAPEVEPEMAPEADRVVSGPGTSTPAAAVATTSGTATTHVLEHRSGSDTCMPRTSQHQHQHQHAGNKPSQATSSGTTGGVLQALKAPADDGTALAIAATAAATAPVAAVGCTFRDPPGSDRGNSSQANTLQSGSLSLHGRSGGLGPLCLGSPQHRGGQFTSSTATARMRRQSALSLMDGPLSCGSHIVHLVQDSGLLDESALQAIANVYGTNERRSLTAMTMVAVDGRPTRERERGAARRMSSIMNCRLSPGGACIDGPWAILANWTGGGGGGGGGGGVEPSDGNAVGVSNVSWVGGIGGGGGGRGGGGGGSGIVTGIQERPSARGMRERMTPGHSRKMATAAAATAAAAAFGDDDSGTPLLALGGAPRHHARLPCSPNYPNHYLYRQLQSFPDSLSLMHTSDSGVQATVVHRRHATVGLVAAIGTGGSNSGSVVVGGGGGGSGSGAVTSSSGIPIIASTSRRPYMPPVRGCDWEGYATHLRPVSDGCVPVRASAGPTLMVAVAAAAAAPGRQPVANAEDRGGGGRAAAPAESSSGCEAVAVAVAAVATAAAATAGTSPANTCSLELNASDDINDEGTIVVPRISFKHAV